MQKPGLAPNSDRGDHQITKEDGRLHNINWALFAVSRTFYTSDQKRTYSHCPVLSKDVDMLQKSCVFSLVFDFNSKFIPFPL